MFDLRSEIRGVSQYGPAGLSPRLPRVPRATHAAAGEYSRRNTASREDTAAPASEQTNSIRTDAVAQGPAPSRQQGGLRGSRPPPRPHSPARGELACRLSCQRGTAQDSIACGGCQRLAVAGEIGREVSVVF